MRSYTAIYGVLYFFFSVGAGLGPLMFGWSFDRNGNYQAILAAAFVALMAGGLALLTLGRYRYRLDDRGAAAVAAADAPAILPSVTAAHNPIAGR
jgi:MFS family permease